MIEARFLEQDLPIILKLWSDYADSWDGGADTAIRFIVDNNHPDLSLGVDDYTCLGLSYDSATYHSYHEAAAVDTAIVDLGSIVRSDGWTIPVGAKSRIDGETPRGRLYSMKVRFSLLDSDETTAFTSKVHVAILGEGNWLGAYFFIPSLCESNR